MNESPRDRLDDRLDEALHRRFDAPDAERILAEAQKRAAAETSRQGSVLRFILWRVAAVLILALVGAWVIHFALNAGGPKPASRYAQRTLEQIYEHDLATGFKPLWVCETDHQFAKTFADRLEQPLLLAQGPSSIEALGLSYANTISNRTVYLLAKVDGQPVIVFADRAGNDPGQTLASGKLHLHRRQLGDLVLYELSPLDEPRLLDLFYIPERIPPPP